MRDMGGPLKPDAGSSLIRRAYATYFASGHYEARYPAPNPTVWTRILAQVTPETRLLDYGCGSGRYLLGLRDYVGLAAGFDVSPDALLSLRASADDIGWDDLAVLGMHPAVLDHYVNEAGPFDVALCLFGVLGHITDPGLRHEALLQIRRSLVPGSGRLLISVPNIARRFRAEQRDGDGGLVHYTRPMQGKEIAFAYQLYDEARLREELADAGFRVTRIAAESVFDENSLLTNPLVKKLDSWLTPFCPVRWGYGIYAEATC